MQENGWFWSVRKVVFLNVFLNVFLPSWHWKIENQTCHVNVIMLFFKSPCFPGKILNWWTHFQDNFVESSHSSDVQFPRAYSNKLTFPLRNRPPDLGLGMASLEHAATGSVFLLPKNHDVRLEVVLPIPQGAHGMIFWLWAGPGGKRPRIVGTEAKCSMVWYMFLYCIHLGHFVV